MVVLEVCTFGFSLFHSYAVILAYNMIFFTFFAVFTLAGAQDLSRILRLYNSGEGSESDEICVKEEVGCLDCNTIGVCISGLKRLTVPCKEAPNLYCSDGSCVPVKDPNCDKEKSAFDCNGNDGTFPDPKDCTIYHMCINGQAFDYYCQQNTVYNHETKSCGKKGLKNKCLTVSCTKDGKIPYPKQFRIYFECSNGEPNKLFTCPRFSVLAPMDQDCTEFCEDEGPIPDLKNPKNFYECILTIGSNYNLQRRQCPQIEGELVTVFDSVKRECVPIEG